MRTSFTLVVGAADHDGGRHPATAVTHKLPEADFPYRGDATKTRERTIRGGECAGGAIAFSVGALNDGGIVYSNGFGEQLLWAGTLD